MNPKEVGNLGERVACYYLKNKGYKILGRNYLKEWSAVSKGEIDIIVRKEDTISFVEVKTIIQPANGGLDYCPEDKFNFQKEKKIIKLAQNWLGENKIPLDSKWQIDLAAVRFSPDLEKAKIKYFPNLRLT